MRDNNMELFDKDVKVTKTILYPPPKRDRSARRGINKFGILLSDYNSYEDYLKSLKKITRKMHSSLPSNKAKRNLSRKNTEYREKHKLYLREWRDKNPELMALARFKDNLRHKKRYRELKNNF